MCDHRTSPPVRASPMLTFPSIPPAPPCVSAAGLSDGSEFGCTASETHVKGTINELCGDRSILKAMLFEERKRKVSFHHCLRGTLPRVESARWARTSAELECHEAAWSFSPVSQTVGVMGHLHSWGKTSMSCCSVQDSWGECESILSHIYVGTQWQRAGALQVLLFMLRHLAFSFAPIMTTMATRDHHLTLNGNVGHDSLCAESAYTAIFPVSTGSTRCLHYPQCNSTPNSSVE